MAEAADFLIVGSGIAGLSAAIALDGADVVILTKADPRAGSTGFAQGGIAAAVGDDDSTGLHADDTLAAADGLADPGAVRILVEDGRRRVQELIDWGAAFDRDADGRLDLTREGAHSVRRVLHARDATGREIGRVLAARAASPRLTVVDHATAVQLLGRDQRVVGVRYLDRGGRPQDILARATLLATGGAGQVFSETTNPEVAAGDGIALGYFAGARVGDMEFVQFHPTVLSVPGAPRYLLSEALRGEGATLVNAAGEAFMLRHDPRGDLAPRDRVARAIVREAARTGAPIYLSMRGADPAAVRARFPLISSLCQRAGLDLATDRIPVGPAAHYVMGGLLTDSDGRTSLPGLFAAGECACTGVHGANRLASNSLLEGLVFGARAGAAMRDWDGVGWQGDADRPRPSPAGETSAMPDVHVDTLREMMWRHAGVFRDATGLEALLAWLDRPDHWPAARRAVDAGTVATAGAWRVVSLLTVGRLIAAAALRRTESRGAHWRDDVPHTDDLHWKRRLQDRLS
jgi:L-aspartate oxidase